MNRPKIRRSDSGLYIEGFGHLWGVSKPMQAVFDILEHSAPFRTTVLVSGACGTGKVRVARAIHALGPDAQGPFVAFNGAAFPSEWIEGQLFGVAEPDGHPGAFEAANGGTLFLDEVDALGPDAQVRLLHAMEDRQVVRSGSAEPVTVQVRLIAATHADLRRAVAEGRFRSDLYYQLDVLHIALVPLRERREDIPVLLRAFLDEFAREYGVVGKTVSPDALSCLMAHNWPGNVRELKQVAERLSVSVRADRIEADDLPLEMRSHTRVAEKIEDVLNGLQELPLAEVEKRMIAYALRQTGGRRGQTAALLGISTRTLQRKLKDSGGDRRF